MSNFIKILEKLNANNYRPTDDEIENYAEKHNLSWGKAEDALIANHNKKDNQVKDEKPKSCWGCGKDWASTRDGRREGNNYLFKYKGKLMCPPCQEEYDQTRQK